MRWLNGVWAILWGGMGGSGINRLLSEPEGLIRATVGAGVILSAVAASHYYQLAVSRPVAADQPTGEKQP